MESLASNPHAIILCFDSISREIGPPTNIVLLFSLLVKGDPRQQLTYYNVSAEQTEGCLIDININFVC